MTLTDTLFPDAVFHPSNHSVVPKKSGNVKNICHNEHKKQRPAVTNGKYSKGFDFLKKVN